MAVVPVPKLALADLVLTVVALARTKKEARFLLQDSTLECLLAVVRSFPEHFPKKLVFEEDGELKPNVVDEAFRQWDRVFSSHDSQRGPLWHLPFRKAHDLLIVMRERYGQQAVTYTEPLAFHFADQMQQSLQAVAS